MESPTGIMPENLMFPNQKAAAIKWLQQAPLPADVKRNLLLGWAITVGMRVSQRDRRAVENTGTDVSYTGTGTYTNPGAIP